MARAWARCSAIRARSRGASLGPFTQPVRAGGDVAQAIFRSSQAGVAGLACRQGDGWTMKALAPDSGAAGELRTAAADIPAPVLAAVDAAIAGETLDAAAESRARDDGWR